MVVDAMGLMLQVPLRTHGKLYAHCLSSGMRTLKMCYLMVKGAPQASGEAETCYIPQRHNP